MSNYSSGHYAEKKAAEHLEKLGYKILDLNWRTPVCEVDIIAKNKDIIYFVEVKSRTSDFAGGGLDYVTPAKLRQMEFAAKCWVQENKYEGDYELSAIELGLDFQVTKFIDTIT